MTRLALAARKAMGLRTGSVPYGWRLAKDRKTLIPHERERRIVAKAKELSQLGSSLSQVCAALYRGGMLSRKGGPFARAQVARMLRMDYSASAALMIEIADLAPEPAWCRSMQASSGRAWIGRSRPWGFKAHRDGYHLEPDAAERAIAVLARDLVAGGMSLRAAAAELERRGHVSRSGRRLAAIQISRMLDEKRGGPSSFPVLTTIDSKAVDPKLAA